MFILAVLFGWAFPVHEQAHCWRPEVVVPLDRLRMSGFGVSVPLRVPLPGGALSRKPSWVSDVSSFFFFKLPGMLLRRLFIKQENVKN